MPIRVNKIKNAIGPDLVMLQSQVVPEYQEGILKPF